MRMPSFNTAGGHLVFHQARRLARPDIEWTAAQRLGNNPA